MTTTYKALGTTDDVTTCEICGKPELKGTVVVAILDADGNREDTIYAGSTCAARRVGGRTTAKQIRDKANSANLARRQAVEFATEKMSWWEPIEFDRVAIREQYFTANPGARGHVNAIERVAEILREAREVIATDGLSAIEGV